MPVFRTKLRIRERISNSQRIVVEKSPLRSSYERGCQEKTLLHSPPGDLDRCLHPGPFFFVERILVLTPGAPQSTTGIRIGVAGLPCMVSCRGSDTIRCESCASQPLASVPTIILCEARGLWLFWVIRGGIGLTRRLGAELPHTECLTSAWILSLEPEHRQNRWVTTEA